MIWLLLFVLALLPTYLAHLLYQTGLKHLAPTRAALLASLEVPVALIAAALFGERFSAWGFLGVILVLAVPLLAVLGDRRLWAARASAPENHLPPVPMREVHIEVG